MTEVSNVNGTLESPESAARALWANRLTPVPSSRSAVLGGPTAEFLASAGLPTAFPFAGDNYRVCTDDELLAPISAAGHDYLALMHHEAGWIFAIDTSSHEIWAVPTIPSLQNSPLFVNTDITRFVAYAGYLNQLVPKCQEAHQQIPEEGEYSHMNRLIGLKDLIVLLEDAQRVLTGWDDRALDGGWWLPEFEQWTVGTPGHGGLTIWLG